MDVRLHRAGQVAQHLVVLRHVAPAQKLLAFLADHPLEQVHAVGALRGIAGQEHQAGGIGGFFG
jgi:hypothetical protein